MKQHYQRFLMKSFFAACILITVGLNTSNLVLASEQEQNSAIAFSDGVWTGAYYAQGTIDEAGDVMWKGWYGGDMNFISTGGLLEGTFTLNGDAEMNGTNLTSSATYSGAGYITGTSELPAMAATEVTTSVVANIDGFPYEGSLTVGAEDCQPLEIILVSATCNYVVGDFVTSVENVYEQYGITSHMVGSFAATRVGNLSEDDMTNYLEEITQLIGDAQKIKDDAANTGQVNWDEFHLLAYKAEQLAAGLSKADDCGTTDEGKYLVIITDVVAEFYRFVVENPEAFSNADLSQLGNFGVRMGVTGSGAPNQEQATELESKMVTLLISRLLSAVETNNSTEILSIYAAQKPLGNPELTELAEIAIEGIQEGN